VEESLRISRHTRDDIERFIIGAKLESVERRAKVLILNLSNHYSLLVHLKMTGQLVWVKNDGNRLVGGHPSPSMIHELPDRSTRVIFEFKSGDKLFFNDQRKFGWIKLVPSEAVASDQLIKRLGPEPLTPAFSFELLASSLTRRRRSPIKAVILDQSTVSGIGNIYADESLHLAKIHPNRLAGSLKPAEVKALHAAIRTIIKSGIDHGGTSFTHYVTVMGGKGDYINHARVFRRQGKPCPVCGTEIKKIRVAGRGTHLCPRCQEAPKV
jgi:formamidopyrimidine-DNA glycosylase